LDPIIFWTIVWHVVTQNNVGALGIHVKGHLKPWYTADALIESLNTTCTGQTKEVSAWISG